MFVPPQCPSPSQCLFPLLPISGVSSRILILYREKIFIIKVDQDQPLHAPAISVRPPTLLLIPPQCLFPLLAILNLGCLKSDFNHVKRKKKLWRSFSTYKAPTIFDQEFFYCFSYSAVYNCLIYVIFYTYDALFFRHPVCDTTIFDYPKQLPWT